MIVTPTDIGQRLFPIDRVKFKVNKSSFKHTENPRTAEFDQNCQLLTQPGLAVPGLSVLVMLDLVSMNSALSLADSPYPLTVEVRSIEFSLHYTATLAQQFQFISYNLYER